MSLSNRWETTRKRSAMYGAIRNYFDHRGFLEIETPLLTPLPIPESHIELFVTDANNGQGRCGRLYLVPSPEVWMKLALAEGSPSLYQISRCFRNGEQLDRWHRWEFTMLEWYRLEADASDNVAMMQDVLHRCADAVGAEKNPEVTGPIRQITMEEAFTEFAGFSLESDLRNAGVADANAHHDNRQALENRTTAVLSRRLVEHGLPGGEADEGPDDLFHRLFLSLVEEQLPNDRPLILSDWPAMVPTLARRLPETPWSDRWELYLGGIETANCYGEENRREALAAYWEIETSQRVDAAVGVNENREWTTRVGNAMPRCSGTAVGLDRLLAVILGAEGLQGLDLFSINDIMPR